MNPGGDELFIPLSEADVPLILEINPAKHGWIHDGYARKVSKEGCGGSSS